MAEAAEAVAEDAALARPPAALTEAEARGALDEIKLRCTQIPRYSRAYNTGQLSGGEQGTILKLLQTPGQRIIDPQIDIESRAGDPQSQHLTQPCQ